MKTSEMTPVKSLQIINEAIEQKLLDFAESKYIDNITEIDEEEFLLATK